MKLRLKTRVTFSLNVKTFVNKVVSTFFIFRFYDDNNLKQDACDRLSLIKKSLSNNTLETMSNAHLYHMLCAFILMLKLKGSEGGEIDDFKYQVVFNDFTKRVRICCFFYQKNLALFNIRRDISSCA